MNEKKKNAMNSIYWIDSRSFHKLYNLIQHHLILFVCLCDWLIFRNENPFDRYAPTCSYTPQGVLSLLHWCRWTTNSSRCGTRVFECVRDKYYLHFVPILFFYFFFFIFFQCRNRQTNTIFPRDVFTVWWPYLFEERLQQYNNSSLFTAAHAFLDFCWMCKSECARVHVLRMWSYWKRWCVWVCDGSRSPVIYSIYIMKSSASDQILSTQTWRSVQRYSMRLVHIITTTAFTVRHHVWPTPIGSPLHAILSLLFY